MVTKKSFSTAIKDLVQWSNSNPDVTIKQSVHKTGYTIKAAFEIKLSKGTLLSLIAPIPDYMVWKIDKKQITKQQPPHLTQEPD